ncbi:MarR family winged helix-turn-helix transcriptional regulator [Pendulispora albinea]|uniref:MarR family transcriptional regulator n=1 Tax=Pendulispora albinea TaxID=2741071 RepID=A0ABZ2M9I4_9BACT
MPSPDDLLRLDEQLCFALYSASRALTRAYADLLEPLGLTYPQYLVLLVLWEEDGATVKRLGERLELDSGTLTPVLKRLEQQGIVARRRSAEDERVVHVHLTAEGKALKSKARRVPPSMACRAGYELSDANAVARLELVRNELRALSRRLR